MTHDKSVTRIAIIITGADSIHRLGKTGGI